jgi:hypothetical protein
MQYAYSFTTISFILAQGSAMAGWITFQIYTGGIQKIPAFKEQFWLPRMRILHRGLQEKTFN